MSAAPSLAEPAGVSRQAFLDAMAQAAYSVSIVATDGPAGRDGLAVSSLASVSADGPRPTLLICLNQASRVTPRLLANKAFSVNLLHSNQQAVADRFAGRSGLPCEQWFADLDWQVWATGAPVFTPALASFDCDVLQSSQIGTHHVIFGAVRAVNANPDGQPLVHAQRRYHQLSHQQD